MMNTFSGLYVPLLTPFTTGATGIDRDAMRRQCEYLISAGVDGLFAVGTTGEFPLLSIDERLEVAECVIHAAANRVKVIIHTGATSTRNAITLTQTAAQMGAAGAAVLPPYYYRYTDPELIDHLSAVLQAAPDFPVFAYNIPLAGNDLNPSLLRQVHQRHKNLVGVKNSTGDLVAFQQFVDDVSPEFCAMIGNDRLILAALAVGASGSVSANALVFPELFVSLHRSYRAGDLDTARQLQGMINKLVPLFEQDNSLSRYRTALRCRGVDLGDGRPPLGVLPEDQAERLRQQLAELSAHCDVALSPTPC